MHLPPARLPALTAAWFAAWCAAFSGALLAQAPAASTVPKEKGPTTIDAERIEGVMDIEVSAGGNAELRQDETTVFGDRIKYNQEFNRIDADGGVRLQQGADRFSGTRLRFDSATETGVLQDPVFSIRGG